MYGIRGVLLWLGCVVALFPGTDADWDGVIDSLDRCPGTAFEDRVDAEGCPVRAGVTITVGMSYDKGEYSGSDTVEGKTQEYQIAYAGKSWMASVSTSYLDASVDEPVTDLSVNSGMGDTYVGVSYTYFPAGYSLSTQLLVKLPTGDDEIGTGEPDAGVYVTALVPSGNGSFFATAGYLVTGDSSNTTYEDVGSLTLGAGSSVGDSLYLSISASYTQPLLDELDAAQSATVFMSYTLTSAWFVNMAYTRGGSDAVADTTVTGTVGFSF